MKYIDKVRFIDLSSSSQSELKASLLKKTNQRHKRKQESKNKVYSPKQDLSLLEQAGQLLEDGDVDVVVAGATHTTAKVIRAAISSVGVRKGRRSISSCFVLHKEETIYLYGDAAVIEDPSVEQLSEIAASSSATLKSLNKIGLSLPPIVGFLSFSTLGSAQTNKVKKVQDAVKLFKESYSNVIATGELQFDAAVDDQVGLKKGLSPAVAGKINCFIFPDLNSGNIAYKITQRLGGFKAIGPILQNLNKPFMDLSRGASVQDIVSVAIIGTTQLEDDELLCKDP